MPELCTHIPDEESPGFGRKLLIAIHRQARILNPQLGTIAIIDNAPGEDYAISQVLDRLKDSGLEYLDIAFR